VIYLWLNFNNTLTSFGPALFAGPKDLNFGIEHIVDVEILRNANDALLRMTMVSCDGMMEKISRAEEFGSKNERIARV
jgi:hypothetical protein